MQNNENTDIILIRRIYSKCNLELNVKHNIRKLLEDDIGESLDDLGYDDAF